jgi:ABC-type phosphate transport system substrate-binding protein
MPVPLIGAAAAAASLVGRLAARSAIDKVAIKAITSSRKTGGITGAGSKSVNPVYREVGPSVKIKYNKQAIENSIKDSQLKTKRPDMSPSRPVVSPPGSGRAVKINSQRNLKAK